MKKFLARLFNLYPYDTPEIRCHTCEALKEQIEYERAQNKELIETITSLIKPIPIIQQTNDAPRPITPKFARFSRTRAELERADRESARIRATSPLVAKSDDYRSHEKISKEEESIRQLEEELNVEPEGA